jgi:hypothetical protein
MTISRRRFRRAPGAAPDLRRPLDTDLPTPRPEASTSSTGNGSGVSGTDLFVHVVGNDATTRRTVTLLAAASTAVAVLLCLLILLAVVVGPIALAVAGGGSVAGATLTTVTRRLPRKRVPAQDAALVGRLSTGTEADAVEISAADPDHLRTVAAIIARLAGANR